jgi:putative Mg2+ transporter-C (MgtC) family protein
MWDFDSQLFLDILVRLSAAIVLGALLGFERELHSHWAGLRTHMGVSIGAAIFAVAGHLFAYDSPAEVTRVIQGIAAGVGFLGAGTILKLSDQLEIRGLTTATSIWLSASVGTAAGLACYELAVAGAIVALIVLAIVRPVEKAVEHRIAPSRSDPPTASQSSPTSSAVDPNPGSQASISRALEELALEKKIERVDVKGDWREPPNP